MCLWYKHTHQACRREAVVALDFGARGDSHPPSPVVKPGRGTYVKPREFSQLTQGLAVAAARPFYLLLSNLPA